MRGPPVISLFVSSFYYSIQLISVVLDASESCQMVNFNIGGSTSTTRKWDIKVTQYACGDYDISGWPGCLQYYTGTANTIQKYVL